jgi:phosphoglycolate phosphatase-like HAD superfamily hydrolase
MLIRGMVARDMWTGQQQHSDTGTSDTGTTESNSKSKGQLIPFAPPSSCQAICSQDISSHVNRNESCVEIRCIPAGSKILIRCNGVVTDNDDTVLLHTGEYIHDGHKARFAIALSELLVEHHKSGNKILDDLHLSRFTETGSIFEGDDWQGYRGKTGKSEDTVLSGILDLAHERFDLAQGTISLNLYREKTADVLARKFDDFMRDVVLDGGLQGLFRSLVEAGVPLSVCSASSEMFVQKALENAGVANLFINLVCSAVKKTADGNYSGNDVRRACASLKVDPRQVIMFGDTMNDVGAAKLAGIPLTIIRIPGGIGGGEGSNAAIFGQLHASMQANVETFGRNPDYKQKVLGQGHAQKPCVLIVHDFSQVVFDRSIEGAKSSSYEEIMAQ